MIRSSGQNAHAVADQIDDQARELGDVIHWTEAAARLAAMRPEHWRIDDALADLDLDDLDPAAAIEREVDETIGVPS